MAHIHEKIDFTVAIFVVHDAKVLLILHRKLGKWLREAREESGLVGVRALNAEVFDVDRHWIPERKTEPGHYHYDLRFMLLADPQEPLAISSESKDLAWVELGRVTQLNPEESMARMVRKTRSA